MRAMRWKAIDAGTEALLAKRAGERQQGRWAAQGGTVGPPAGDTPGTAELRGLARLRDAGVITDEEFRAKKRRVLGI